MLPESCIVADRQTEVIERCQRVAVFGLKLGPRLAVRWRFVEAVAAVLGDHQAPAHGVQRADGICVAEGEAVGDQRERERMTGCRWLRRRRSGRPRRPSPRRRDPRSSAP